MTMDLPTISEAALQLSIDERLQLAQRLWESVSAPPTGRSDDDSISVAQRRARELDENPQLAIPHEEVMESIRHGLK
jgi:putative addiction module component (TIGR02574 family)